MDRQTEVVVIDDHPDDTETGLRGAGDACRFDVIDVRDVIKDSAAIDFTTADVILVDHDLEPLKGEPPPGASNGIALIAVLRQHLSDLDSIPLLALYTNDERLVPRDPEDPKAHMVAHANAFDWAFAKNAKGPAELAGAIASLASAAVDLRDAFGNNPSDEYEDLESDIEKLHQVLGLPQNTPWSLAAQREIAAAQPPVFSREDDADPDAIRLWLLHRIVPYPTFIIGVAHAAARVGLSVTDFAHVMQSSIGDAFAPARYTGPLCDFTPTKYWRAGIEHGAREIAGGFDTSVLRARLNEATGRELAFVDHPRPVVGLDSSLKFSPTPVEPSKTVRVHIDGWPSYAETPRMLRSVVRTSELRNMVLDDDKEFIEGNQP